MVPRHLSEIPISSYGMTTPNSSNGSSNLPSPVPCRPLSPVPSPNVPRWLPTCCIPSCWLVSSILWYVHNLFYSPKEDEESIDILSLVGDILILKISQSLICQIFSFVSTHFYMFSGRPCLLVVERIPFEYSHWSIVEFGCYRFGGIWSSSHDWWCHRLGCCHHLRSQTWSVLRRRWQSVRRTLGDRPPFCYAPILGYFLSLVRLVRIQPVSNTATSRSTKKTNEQILRVPFLFCFAFVQICF